ncbi:MAG TPA: putative metal-dependent hydrolase [Candidatus Acidoferrales bacterium]|nr:putative metal-dependent hydrolase [Candidatus Acidoferrales bacterium]
MNDPRYPIGKLEKKGPFTPAERSHMVESIATAPAQLRAATKGLDDRQLDTPYREGGWTVRQVIHHVADSHMNSYVRFRLALTEKEPTIKAYDEKLWAELPDARKAPVDTSLAMLDAMHHRWVILLRSFKPEDFARTMRHPERGPMTLDDSLAIYEWHGRHHAAHITELRKRNGW